MTDTIDAMKMTPAEFAAAKRRIENDHYRETLRRRDADDLAKASAADTSTLFAKSYPHLRQARLSTEEQDTLLREKIKSLAEAHAKQQLAEDQIAFLTTLKKKYGTA